MDLKFENATTLLLNVNYYFFCKKDIAGGPLSGAACSNRFLLGVHLISRLRNLAACANRFSLVVLVIVRKGKSIITSGSYPPVIFTGLCSVAVLISASKNPK